ncbi:MAG: CPBP family intramembrane glutamic endopeptidase [Actinomycetota bacterium]
MTNTAPPPPPPPGALPPPPAPAHPPAANDGWKDRDRPPHADFSDDSRWGLGDAFISFGVFVVTSILGISITLFLGVDPLAGLWLPVLVALPQLAQGIYVAAVGREQGAGLDRDFGFRVRWLDLLVGFLLFIAAIVSAGVTAVALEALGFETPNASVAELIDDAADPETTDGGIDLDEPDTDLLPDADGDQTNDGQGETTTGDDPVDNGVSLGIVLVAIFAATAVPIIEELVYRGLWWSALLKRGVPEGWTLVITSLAFAAAHFEPGRFVVLFVLGMGLGLGRLITGRIGASIVTHALINGLAMIGLLIAIDQGWDL